VSCARVDGSCNFAVSSAPFPSELVFTFCAPGVAAEGDRGGGLRTGVSSEIRLVRGREKNAACRKREDRHAEHRAREWFGRLKFCGESGTRLLARCAECGARNLPSQKFCCKCGAQILPPLDTKRMPAMTSSAPDAWDQPSERRRSGTPRIAPVLDAAKRAARSQRAIGDANHLYQVWVWSSGSCDVGEASMATQDVDISVPLMVLGSLSEYWAPTERWRIPKSCVRDRGAFARATRRA